MSRKRRKKTRTKPPRQKKPLTAAARRQRRKRRRETMIIFINGKQKRVPRPQLIEGLTVDEFIRRNADPIWLHQNGMWELLHELYESPTDPPLEICFENDGEIANWDDEPEPESFGIQFTWDEYYSQLSAQEIPF